MIIFKKILITLLILSIPFLLITSSIRIALTPIFINFEYRLPGFPDDPYGFSRSDRLFWAQYTIDYLLGEIPYEQISSQILPSGDPLYNERELTHLEDVSILSQIVLRIWVGLIAVFLIMIPVAKLMGWTHDWLKALKTGSMLTIGTILAILLFVLLDFNQLFTQFHVLFFEGDSWLFYLSDNLIRLFPLRFWMDLFIFIGGLSLVFALIMAVYANRHMKKI